MQESVLLNHSVVSVRFPYRQYRKAYIIKYIDADFVLINITIHYRMPQWVRQINSFL